MEIKMKSLKKLTTLSLSLIVIVSSNVFAEPTKKETYDFIANKTAINADGAWFNTSGDHEGISTKLTASEDMCRLTYTTEIYDSSKRLLSSEIEEIDLKQANPKTIEYAKATDLTLNFYRRNFGLVRIDTFEKKPLISYKKIVTEQGKINSSYNKDSTRNKSLLQLLTQDYDSAQRVVKAFKHLVSLCGGKDELF